MYYKVVSFGASHSAVTTDPDAAWADWERRCRRRYPGYEDRDFVGGGNALRAHSPRLIERDTRRAAQDADVS